MTISVQSLPARRVICTYWPTISAAWASRSGGTVICETARGVEIDDHAVGRERLVRE